MRSPVAAAHRLVSTARTPLLIRRRCVPPVASLVIALLLPLGACLPYPVGRTAHTLEPGRSERVTSGWIMPNAADPLASHSAEGSRRAALVGMDFEWRTGVAEGTDVGVRIPSLSGVVLSVKHRLTVDPDPDSSATAFMLGAGVVNFGEHGHVELTVMRSLAVRNGLAPYFGLRAMQVVPLTRAAVSDSPTIGGFLGMRLGDGIEWIAPEIAVFHDRSALGLRKGSVIVVPSVSIKRSPFRRGWGGF